MKENFYDMADEMGLETITTTSESNGYPNDLERAVIGFSNYSEARSFADKFGCDIEIFKRRNGWDLWYRTGISAHDDFDVMSFDFGEDYNIFSQNSKENFVKKEIIPYLAGCESIDELRAMIDARSDIYDQICELNDSEFVLVKNGHYFNTLPKRSMHYYDEDSTQYVIGVLEPELPEIEYIEELRDYINSVRDVDWNFVNKVVEDNEWLLCNDDIYVAIDPVGQMLLSMGEGEARCMDIADEDLQDYIDSYCSKK